MAVKSYQENVSRNSVQCEASVINVFDHPGKGQVILFDKIVILDQVFSRMHGRDAPQCRNKRKGYIRQKI